MTRRHDPSGFTLIELMVSVTILAIMILIVNEVLYSAMRTVKASADSIRCNANARAVTDVFRADLTGLCKTGYLAITEGATSGSVIATHPGDSPANPTPDNPRTWPPHDSILLSVVAPASSVTAPGVTANAATVNYGLASGWYGGKGTGESHLYRRFMATGGSLPWHGTGNDNDFYGDQDDGYGVVLENQIRWSRAIADRLLARYGNPAWRSPGLIVPPGDPNGRSAPPGSDSSLYYLYVPAASSYQMSWFDWPLLVTNANLLTVEWTDGQAWADGSLKWYSSSNPRDGAWASHDKNYQTANPTLDRPEFALPVPAPYVSGNAYCALWTGDRNYWPRAVRVRYNLTFGIASSLYEVIVDLAK